MKKNMLMSKSYIVAVLTISAFSYLQIIINIYSWPEDVSTKIIDFPCNIITKNISLYDKMLHKAKTTLPAAGVIGYSADCYNINYNYANGSNPLTEIDYDCLAGIYAVQYALAPLVMIRSSNPSIIISNCFSLKK